MTQRQAFMLGRTNAQRKHALLSTIGHSAMHSAAPNLHDIPARAILQETHGRLFPAIIIAPKGSKDGTDKT